MAESARLIFSRRTKKSIGNIIFDAFISEEHMRNSKATKYPVETGAEISDHIINEPIRLTISAFIEAFIDGGNILESFRQLDELIDQKTLVTVVTGLKVYENMHITSYSIPRTVTNGGSLNVNINLEEFRFVSSQSVSSQSVSIPISQLSDADDNTNKQSQESQDVGKTTSGQTQTEDSLAQIRESAEALADYITGRE